MILRTWLTSLKRRSRKNARRLGLVAPSQIGKHIEMLEDRTLLSAVFGDQNILPPETYAYSVFAADLDGDGDNDVLSGSYLDDKVSWHENLGGGSFGDQQVISTEANGVQSVHAADLDGDGDQDVLSASEYDNKIAWYENLGEPGSYAAAILADSPRAYWRLGDSGTTAADSSGNGYDGIYKDGVTVGVPGAPVGDSDTAARFYDVSTNRVEVPGAVLNGLSDLTVDFWLNMPSTGNVGSAQIVNGAKPANDNEFNVGFHTGTEFRFTPGGSNNQAYVDWTIPSVADDQWHHFALVRNDVAIHTRRDDRHSRLAI